MTLHLLEECIHDMPLHDFCEITNVFRHEVLSNLNNMQKSCIRTKTSHWKMVFGNSAIRKTSYRPWFLVYQRVLPQACPFQHLQTPSRQERNHPTSSSSASSSPTTATSSDSETQERGDRTESDTSPVPVSSFNVDDRTEQPVGFWDSGVAARILGKFGGWQSSWTRRLSRQFFSWSFFRANYKETWGFG